MDDIDNLFSGDDNRFTLVAVDVTPAGCHVVGTIAAEVGDETRHFTYSVVKSADDPAGNQQTLELHVKDGELVVKLNGEQLSAARTFEQPLGEPWYRMYYDTRARVVVFPDLEPGDVGKQSIVNDPLVFSYDKLSQRTIPGLWSANGDDGTLNYPDSGDLISHTIKATVEAQVNWRNFGAFTRFSAFYDFENEGKDVLSDIAQERTGKDVRLLDLYVYGSHQPGGKFLDWRLGKQVVSWGESTFIQGGINVINPVDVSALRVPGAEHRDEGRRLDTELGDGGHDDEGQQRDVDDAPDEADQRAVRLRLLHRPLRQVR